MSYHGLAGGFSIDTAAIGKQIANIVVPPVVSAVKAEVPGFLAAVQPALIQQGNSLMASLQPQLEKQAIQAANALQPMIDKQFGVAEKRLSALIDVKVHDIASGAELKRIKKQAVVALAIHGALVVLGVAVVMKMSRK